MKSALRIRSLILAAALAMAVPFEPAVAGEVLVFAAASQRDALDAVIETYAKTSRDTVKASYQSSSTLARQIAQGAPADVYISANPKWMNYLGDRDLIDTTTRTDVVGNGLVLVAAKMSKIGEIEVTKAFGLAGMLGKGRLAVGDPDHVPAGIYAKQALQSLGVWESVEAKLVRAVNVRAALALVARGEAPLGIVYSSDALSDETVKVVGVLPDATHGRIVYPAAVTAGAKNAAGAKSFLAFLKSPEAAKIYGRYGFRVLK